MRARARHRGDRPLADDAGVTLVEQVVAMSIFTIVMAVFMGGLISMTTSTSRVQNTSDAGDSLRTAFLTMDRQVRYADSVNLPGRGATSGDWFVEFRSPARSVVSGSGTTTVHPCTQWRYDTTGGALLVRTWNDGETPTTQWTPLSRVVKQPTAAPFTVQRAASPQLFQRLSVSLSSARGTGAAAGSAEITSTFTARNSSAASPSNADDDGNGISDTPVCTAGVRS